MPKTIKQLIIHGYTFDGISSMHTPETLLKSAEKKGYIRFVRNDGKYKLYWLTDKGVAEYYRIKESEK